MGQYALVVVAVSVDQVPQVIVITAEVEDREVDLTCFLSFITLAGRFGQDV